MKHQMIPAPWRESIGELREEISQTIDQWVSKLKPQHASSDLESDFWKNPLSNLSWDSLRVDIQEEGDDLLVVAEIPGMKKEDLKVHLDGNWLTISGEKESQREQKKGQMHYSECSYGAFSRTIPLPCGVNSDAVKAKYRHGVLKLTLPKSPSAKGRHIDVSDEA